MLEKSFSLLCFLKQKKNEPKRYIYLRITVDGHAVEWSTKMQWDENRWDQKKGWATGTKEDARSINYNLDTLDAKVASARRELLENDDQVTAIVPRGDV